MKKIRILLPATFAVLLSLGQSVLAQENWSWQNPFPQGNTLNAVQFIDATIVIAVGESGTVLRSTNGGVSWPLLRRYGLSLRDIDFVSPTIGLAASKNVVMWTSDGGVNWISQATGLNSEWQGVSLSSATSATVVGYFPGFNQTPPGELVAQTTDGGNSWSNISGRLNPVYLCYGVSFAGNNGTIVGSNASTFTNVLQQTTDGGQTWLTKISGEAFFRVRFFNPQTGAALGSRIHATTDGGETWMLRHNGTGFALRDIGFVSEDTWLAVGDAGTILRTTDAGLSWLQVPSGVTLSLRGIAMRGEIGIIVGEAGTILRTADSGSTWSFVSTTVTSRFLSSISYTGPTEEFVLGEAGTILRTTDSGVRWVPQMNQRPSDLYSISVKGRDTMLAVGADGTILRTTDAGFNWPLIASGTGSHLYGVSLRTSGSGITVGRYGVILKSTNFGESWLPRSVGGTDWYAVSQVSDSIIFVAGTGAIRSTDAGESWTQLNTGGNFYGVTFWNPSIGFLAGWRVQPPFAFIVRLGTTTDGGLTWNWYEEPYTQPSTPYPNAVVATGPTTAIVVGNSGRCWRTTNTGTSWQSISMPTNNNLYGMSFLSPILGTVVGSRGTILRTTTGGVTWIAEQHNFAEVVPTEFQLAQNYPNPFNPITTIRFSLPSPGPNNVEGRDGVGSHVSLKVYDVLGREVATLVNEEMRAGNYERTFNANGLSSGVYFYRLQAGSFVETRTLAVVK